MVNIYWYKTQLYLLDSFNSSIIKTYWIYLNILLNSVDNSKQQKWGRFDLGLIWLGADLIWGRFDLGPIWLWADLTCFQNYYATWTSLLTNEKSKSTLTRQLLHPLTWALLLVLFSSPKGHVRYCHHLASVVRPLTFSYFNLLLWNNWAKWNQTWQKASI